MAESIQLIWDLIARDQASSTFRTVGAEAEGASRSIGKLLGGFTALAAGAAVAASVKAAADFQSSMLMIQAQANDTTDNLGQMSDAVLALAGQVAQSPEALATSIYHMASVGLRGQDALNALRIAAEGADVGHADLESTTNALTATIASGMLPATENYAQAMGQLNTIVGAGDMKMQDLNDSLGTGLLVTVKQYGVNLNDVGAALADFGDNNIRGQEAATRLRMAVQAIAAPSKNAAKVLGEIGVSTTELKDKMEKDGLNSALQYLHQHLVNSGIAASQWGDILTNAFTKKAGGGVVTLMGTFDRFEQKYQQVSKGADTFGSAWEATTKTASFQFTALKDSVDALGIKLGTALLPPLADFAHWLTATAIPAMEQFGASLTAAVQSPQFQTFLSGVVTAGGEAWRVIQQVSGVLLDLGRTVLPPILSAGGNLLKFFTDLPAPIQLAVAGFAALRVAASKGMFDGLVSAASGVRGAFRDFGADVSATSGVLREAGVPLSGFAATLQTTTERGVGGLKSAGQGLMNMLGGPWGAALAGAGVAATLVVGKFQAGSQATQDWTHALEQGGAAAREATDAMAKQTADLAKNDQGFMGFINRIDGYSAAQRAAAGSTSGATKVAQDHYNSLGLVDQKTIDLANATDNLNQVLKTHSADSLAAREAIDGVRVAQSGLDDVQKLLNQSTKTGLQLTQEQASAELALTGSALAVKQSYDEFNGSLDQYNKDLASGQVSASSLRSEQDALNSQTITVAQSAGAAGEAWAKANGITDTATASQYAQLLALQKVSQAMGTNVPASVTSLIDSLSQSVAQGHLTQQQMDGVTASVDGIPGQKQINVTADTSQARDSLDSLLTSYQHVQYTGTSIMVNGRVVAKADGGPIIGPGTGTSDSIPALLSNGEHVWTAHEVASAGGHNAVARMRKSVLSGAKAFAAGGPVWGASVDRFTAQASQGMLDSVGSFMSQFVTSAPGSGSGVEQWRGVVDAVLRNLGLPLAADNGVLSLIQHESGGNPNAINLWDSNAMAGHPSQGLMQTIPSTFAAYAGPYASRGITDPFANVYAGVSYAAGNYGLGMLMAGGRHNSSGAYIGYKDGTDYVPETGLAMLHQGESVRPATMQGAPYEGQAITLQLDREAVTDLLDGRIVTFAEAQLTRGAY